MREVPRLMLGLFSARAVLYGLCLVMVLLITVFILWIALAIPAPVQAEVDPCEKFDTFAAFAGFSKMEWVGYPQGWLGFPDDTEFQESGRVEFDDNTGVWGYVSPSTGERFIFYFWDMTVDGDPPGLHHLCGPYQSNGHNGFSVN